MKLLVLIWSHLVPPACSRNIVTRKCLVVWKMIIEDFLGIQELACIWIGVFFGRSLPARSAYNGGRCPVMNTRNETWTLGSLGINSSSVLAGQFGQEEDEKEISWALGGKGRNEWRWQSADRASARALGDAGQGAAACALGKPFF